MQCSDHRPDTSLSARYDCRYLIYAKPNVSEIVVSYNFIFDRSEKEIAIRLSFIFY